MAQSPGRILIVEDDDHLRQFMVAALESSGLQVHGVSNGLDALKLFKQSGSGFDLIVLDLLLPWVNGLELFELLRSDPATSRIPVLVATGTMISPRQFEGASRLSLLHKPFNDQQLIVAVETLLHGAAA